MRDRMRPGQAPALQTVERHHGHMTLEQGLERAAASFCFLISSFCFCRRWLFVSETVEGSETPDEIHGVYADHRTVAKKFRERAQGNAVIRIVEGRDQDGGV